VSRITEEEAEAIVLKAHPIIKEACAALDDQLTKAIDQCENHDQRTLVLGALLSVIAEAVGTHGLLAQGRKPTNPEGFNKVATFFEARDALKSLTLGQVMKLVDEGKNPFTDIPPTASGLDIEKIMEGLSEKMSRKPDAEPTPTSYSGSVNL
jgi:hypothetical protein